MLFKKLFHYFKAKADSEFEDRADAAIQLKQAITELQQQHRRLQQQAGLIIGQQKQCQIQLSNKQREHEKLTAQIEQYLETSLDQLTAPEQRAQVEGQAERAANRLCLIESEIEDLKQLHADSDQASQHARTQVEQSKYRLDTKMAEYKRLQLQNNQVKMQETINKSRGSMELNPAVPDMDRVKEKIETRYANALGAAEIADLDAAPELEYDSGAGQRKLAELRQKMQSKQIEK